MISLSSRILPGSHMTFSCYFILVSFSLQSVFRLRLSQLWHLWRALVSYFVECPSVCVCLEVSHDWTEAVHLGQEHHQSDAAAFLWHHVARSMMSMCLITGGVTLITGRRSFLLVAPLWSCYPSHSHHHLGKILWDSISPVSPQTFTHQLASTSKICTQQVLCSLLTIDFQCLSFLLVILMWILL